MPVPGDVRGLPAGSQFQRDALSVGEAVLVTHDELDGVGLVPEFEYFEFDDVETESTFEPEPRALSWTVYSLPVLPPPQHHDLVDAEYELRSAVRSAADTLVTLRAGVGVDIEDPRGMVEDILEAGRMHRIPRPRPHPGREGVGERRPRGRDHHRELGPDADRPAEFLGGSDRR